MLDMKTVGRNIKNARTEKNMTQLELADILGVSYQAVSNWERGNTMPDITKLPEISKTLEIEIATLLGEDKSARAITKVIEENPEPLNSEELVDVAPILRPNELNREVKKTYDNEALNIGAIVGLAPYLDNEMLDDIVNKIIEINTKELVPLAPYLSNETLINLTNRLGASNVHDLVPLAPYLPDEALNNIVASINVDDLGGIKALVPFLSDSALDNIVDKAIEADKISELSDVACFLGRKSLKKIANQLIHSEDSNTLSKFAMYI